jgi:hypothetical protein
MATMMTMTIAGWIIDVWPTRRRRFGYSVHGYYRTGRATARRLTLWWWNIIFRPQRGDG